MKEDVMTMRALVVFESMFGNTEQVAHEVARGLSETIQVDTREVGATPTVLDDEIAILVVGGPTHAFSMSKPATRQDAAKDASGAPVSGSIGIREWIAAISGDPAGIPLATFDTKVARPRLPGSAARAAEKRLRQRGFRIAASAETFYVRGKAGPLLPGERERARAWGRRLAHITHTIRADHA